MVRAKNIKLELNKLSSQAGGIIANIWRSLRSYIIPIVIAVLGFWTPLSMLTSLGKIAKSKQVEIKKSDTLNVRLLNGPVEYANTIKSKHADTGLATGKVADSRITGSAGIKPAPDSGSKARTTTAVAATIPVKPINNEALKKNWETGHSLTAVVASYLWWLLVGFAVISFVLFMFYFFEPKLTIQMQKDKDPEELTKLFIAYSTEIAKLGIPRKIKRFSNKVRFQYHLLKNKDLIESQAANDLFMKVLLAIENERKHINEELSKIRETSDSEQQLNKLSQAVLEDPSQMTHVGFIDMIKKHFSKSDTILSIEKNGALIDELYKTNKSMVV